MGEQYSSLNGAALQKPWSGKDFGILKKLKEDQYLDSEAWGESDTR